MGKQFYKPEYIERAAKLAYLGATDKMLAAAFGCRDDTIRDWKNKHPEFAQALLKQKLEVDGKVARTLFERAMGYDVEEEKAIKVKDGKSERVEVVKVTRRVEPNVTAQIFWLKNRQPALWRDVQQVEHNGLADVLTQVMDRSRGLPHQFREAPSTELPSLSTTSDRTH